MRAARRRITITSAVLLAVAGLSACSEDSDEAYCETLREQREVLADLAGDAGEPDTDVLGRTLESLQTLRDDAPSELDDEYTTVVNAWEAMAEVVADVGIDPADYNRRETLRELPRADSRRLRQTAAALASPRVSDASAGIEDHALQVCEVDFSA